MELYKKIFIKSEADLPKEEGSYYAHDRSYSNDFIITDFFDKKQHGIFNWLQNIDWYFQPLPESPAQGMPTDEEIELELKKYLKDFFDQGEYDNMVSGAKWFKSRLAPQEELRKELKDFNSWMCGKQYDGKIPLIKTCIDEYLKQKK